MARIIDSVVGHQTEIAQLFKLKKAGRWPHAILFVGPSGVGKKKIALGFAQSLVCETSPEACGVCGACLRIEKQQSESLSIISPDPELARPIIKIEKIRDLLDSLSLASMGTSRVVIIDQAQFMNAQAANALLKTLEEPSENIYFILIANDIHQFLPTIRSRVQVARFSALTYEQLKLIKPQLPDWTYRSCRGQIDKLEILSSPEGKTQREEALRFFEQFCSDKNFLMDKAWKDSVKDRTWALFSINCWLQLCRDAVILKTQAQKFILNTDQIERLKQTYEFSTKKLLWLCQNLILAEKEINSNFDTSLVFENLWIQYARLD